MLAEDAPEKKAATLQFFSEVEREKYEIYISEAVTTEINAASGDKFIMLDNLIKKYKPVELELDHDVTQLTEAYIENRVLSRKHYTDLLHLAFASASAMNVLVSWNLNHLVRMKTFTLGNNVNRANGYHEILIFTPQGVIEHED
jgi:hypothetical protein